MDTGASSSEKIVAMGEDLDFVWRAGAKKPKLESLNVAQWSSANIAILYKLVEEGTLPMSNSFDYLSYTSYIYSLVQTHDLVSVFYYDREYRRLQHMHKFRWGTAVNHLAPGFLRLKPVGPSTFVQAESRKPAPKGVEKKLDNTHSKFNFASHTGSGKTICRRYNGRMGCNMRGCKFEHVCNVPGCGQAHPGVQHNNKKNQ